MNLTIGTFNVHGWVDAQGQSRFDETVSVLRPLSCDFLVLNEVPSKGGALARLARELDMIPSYAAAGWAGNAILSRTPPRNIRSIELGGSEIRTALIGSYILEGGELAVVCTHLDDRLEQRRLAQLEALLTHLATEKRPHVIAGDLNALNQFDYPPVHLEAVRVMRREHGREAPVDNVTTRLDAFGYVDATRLGAFGADQYRSMRGAPLPRPLRSSCWAGTRIDYVWIDDKLASRVTKAQAAIVDSDVSDHRPVVVTLSA